MKKIIIKEKMFGGGFYILVCPELEFVNFINKKYKDNAEINGAKGQFYRNAKADLIGDNKIHNYIWLKEFSLKKQDNINTLFHEVQHFIIWELNRRGINLIYTDGEPNDEPFTYFAGEIYKLVYNNIHKI